MISKEWIRRRMSDFKMGWYYPGLFLALLTNGAILFEFIVKPSPFLSGLFGSVYIFYGISTPIFLGLGSFVGYINRKSKMYATDGSVWFENIPQLREMYEMLKELKEHGLLQRQ